MIVCKLEGPEHTTSVSVMLHDQLLFRSISMLEQYRWRLI